MDIQLGRWLTILTTLGVSREPCPLVARPQLEAARAPGRKTLPHPIASPRATMALPAPVRNANAVGGVLKDIYRLPRPPPLLVWRDFAAGDSTGAKDFGFVSTHTANAVTNSFGLLL